MAALGTQVMGLPSALPVFVAASAGGDTAIPGNNSFLTIKNGSGGSINVTLDVQGSDDFGNARPDLVVAVAASTERRIPLRHSMLVGSNGLVNIAYSAVTSVTVAVESPS